MRLVSVVMPVYNAAPYVEAAIKSVLDQTYQNIELIIINDGSTDKSLEIISTFKDDRIKLINQENNGLSKSLNIGIYAAESEYIARMDADDICAPNRIEKQVNFLDENPKCVVVGSNANIITMQGDYLYTSTVLTDPEKIRNFLPECALYHSSTMFRKSIWLKADGYLENIRHHHEDKILWNQMAKYGNLCNLKEALIDYRIVPSSVTNKRNRNTKLKEISNRIIETNTVTEADLIEINNMPASTKNQNLADYYVTIGHIYHYQKNDRLSAAKNILLSLYYNPYSFIALKGLVACLLPLRLLRILKN